MTPRKTPNLKELLYIGQDDIKASFKIEKSYLNNEWWYIPTLVAAAREQEVIPYDLHIASLDLGRMPWQCESVLHFVQHMGDIEICDFRHPVIQAPAGWVMNGWHRIAKAIMMNKPTIKAIRLNYLPPCDGVSEKEEEE